MRESQYITLNGQLCNCLVESKTFMISQHMVPMCQLIAPKGSSFLPIIFTTAVCGGVKEILNNYST